jgi:proteasome lid subunit RPN8/RPN11
LGYRERGTVSPHDDRPPTAFRLSSSLRGRIVDHLAVAAPLESVGLLGVAQAESPDVVRAVRFYPGTNVDASPTRYTMDPAEVIAALRDIETNGWWLGAIVHSHPASPAVPSATDLREAYYPDALMVIVSLARGTPELRAWRLVSDPTATASFVEVPILSDQERPPQPSVASLKEERR